MGILKLNLLPAYLAERRKTLGMVKYMLMVVVAVLVVSAMWVGVAKRQVKVAADQLAEATRRANDVLKIEQDEQAVKAQLPAYAQWVTWYAQVNTQGEHMAATLEALNEWLFKDIEVTQLAVRGNAVSFDGRARNLEAMKAFYLQMKGATPFTTPPQVQYQIQGWTVSLPPDDTKPLTFKVQGSLKDALALAMPGIPAKTITLSGGRGGATSLGGAGGAGLAPTGARAGAGGGGGNMNSGSGVSL